MKNNKAFKRNIPLITPIKLGIVNSFIIKGEKAVIIDTGYPGNGEIILDRLYANLIKPSDISLIVITHGHIDHYGSADELRKLTGVPVAMHGTDAQHLKAGINYIGKPAGLLGTLIKSLLIRTDEKSLKPLHVDITFDEEFNLQDFGIDGKVIHTPGHTEGSVSLILSGGEAIVGDLIMGGILFKKKPRYPLFVGNMADLRASIGKVIELSPKTIYASHGGPFSAGKLKELLGD